MAPVWSVQADWYKCRFVQHISITFNQHQISLLTRSPFSHFNSSDSHGPHITLQRKRPKKKMSLKSGKQIVFKIFKQSFTKGRYQCHSHFMGFLHYWLMLEGDVIWPCDQPVLYYTSWYGWGFSERKIHLGCIAIVTLTGIPKGICCKEVQSHTTSSKEVRS